MCSELDNKSAPSTRPAVSEEKHIKFEQGTTDTLSESEDDDIGSEELMCNENIDVNDKESDDSDEEELTNRVFPQQRFSPVPFSGRRSQTPDIGKIRYSPIALPTKRAVTPNIYEQMFGKSQSHQLPDIGSSKPHSKMADIGFREPKGLPHSNRSSEKSESTRPLSGQFVRPKLPTAKTNSPGLTVSGYFQPTGSVFRPSQPLCSSTTTKFTPASSEGVSKPVASSIDSSFSQPALFPSHFTKFSPGVNTTCSLLSNPALAFQVKSSSSPCKGSVHGSFAVSTNQHTKLSENTPVSSRVPFQHQKEVIESSAGNAPTRSLTTPTAPSVISSSTTAPVVGQVAWPALSAASSLVPLTVSVATHAIPPFHQSVKSTPALSPGAKGVLKPIAPLLSPPLIVTSPTGTNSGDKAAPRVLLAKKPAPLSGLVLGQTTGKRGMAVDVKQGFPSHGGLGYYNTSPVALNANQGIAPSVLQSPTPRPAHVSPRQLPLSPRPSAANTSQLSPKGAKFHAAAYPSADKVAASLSSTVPSRNASHTGTPTINRQSMKAEGTPALEHPSRDQVEAPATQQLASSVNVEELSGDPKGHVNSKPILKRFIADGMEE